jgi:DNA-binding beta-propeller fold protein YncE
MNAELQYSASVETGRVIAELGRTEDVQFSPSNRRLAVAAFHANRIAVFEIAIARREDDKPEIALNGVVEIAAATLKGPHGLCFLDDDTLVVANREGSVEVFDVPAAGTPARARTTPRRTVLGGPTAQVVTPGSVAAVGLDDGTIELLVCNNYVNWVTRHVLDPRSDFAPTSDETFLQRDLDVPDGVCFSPDGAWIAISNHNTHSVLLYDRCRRLGPDSEPDGVLRNVLCPHGVRFTFDQEFVLVADAAARYVNVYKKDGESWHGTRDPVRLFPVMAPEDFARGQGDARPRVDVRIPGARLLRPRGGRRRLRSAGEPPEAIPAVASLGGDLQPSRLHGAVPGLAASRRRGGPKPRRLSPSCGRRMIPPWPTSAPRPPTPLRPRSAS